MWWNVVALCVCCTCTPYVLQMYVWRSKFRVNHFPGFNYQFFVASIFLTFICCVTFILLLFSLYLSNILIPACVLFIQTSFMLTLCCFSCPSPSLPKTWFLCNDCLELNTFPNPPLPSATYAKSCRVLWPR